MKKLLAIVTCTIFVLALFGCGESSSTTSTTTVQGTELSETSYSTTYGNLPIPESYLDNVSVEVVSEDPYTISFYNKNTGTKLYTIYYGEEHEIFLGTLKVDDNQDVELYVDFAELNKEGEDYEINVTLQSDINSILDSLEESGNFTKGE